MIASFGASISLVAAAALTLFTVSAVVALEGWPGLGRTSDQPALIVGDDVVAGTARGTGTARRSEPVVLRAPQRPAPARPEPAERSRPATAVRAGDPPVRRRAEKVVSAAPTLDVSMPSLDIEVGPAPMPKPRPEAVKAPVKTGDVVRQVGDGLAGTVKGTGDAVQELAAPISPQVAKALQDLTYLVAGVLQKTTGLLAGTLDKLVASQPPQQ